MANVKTKLFDLVKAQLKKSDGDKAIDTLTEMVDDNKNSFDNELFQAKKDVKTASKAAAALESTPSATGAAIIAAERNVAILEANVASIEAIIARRF
jgi:hypothetical protein